MPIEGYTQGTLSINRYRTNLLISLDARSFQLTARKENEYFLILLFR